MCAEALSDPYNCYSLDPSTSITYSSKWKPINYFLQPASLLQDAQNI